LKVFEAQMRALGAIPQVMAFSEVYQALATGVVDGTENPPSNEYTQKMHEVQKYTMLSEHGYVGYAVIVNKRFWDGLAADIRAALTKAMKEATDFTNDIAVKENEEALEEIRKSGKSQIITLSAEQKVAWRKALEPVYAEMTGRVGKAIMDEFAKEVASATH
jgi:C4-dicarboxylate-binding protein DctP